jgi:hypothetical protein
MRQQVGSLMYLYLEELELSEPVETSEFLIYGAAQAINKADNRNWLPIIVKQTGEDQYQVIGNTFTYAVAEKAGLEKVWCIIADDSPITRNISQMLAQEKIPRINLATATFEEIKLGLEYLINRPVNSLKGVNLAKASSRIDEAPRHYWREGLKDVVNLKCGITRGKKLEIFKEVFYVIPEPLPEMITDRNILEMFNATELKQMAKKRKIKGYSKKKRADLIKVLSQTPEKG